jgi:monovalent cation/hydrogen antiporter
VGITALLNGIEMPAEPPAQAEEARARVAAAEAAIEGVQRSLRGLTESSKDAGLSVAAASRIADFYRARIAEQSQDGDEADRARQILGIERKLRIAALHAERDEIFRRMRERELGAEAGQRLVRELDLLEARYRA